MQHWGFQQGVNRDVLQSDSEHPQSSSIQPAELDAMVTDNYPGAAKVVDQCGTMVLDIFDEDRFVEIRNSDNLYYPFANRPEWELAEYLLTSGLSMAAIDRFLSLLLVSRASLGMLDPFGSESINTFRSSGFSFLSNLPCSYVDLVRSFPKLLHGSANM